MSLLNDINASTLISEDIKKSIEQDIKPKYYFENKIASLKDTLLMLTLCAGIITSILPSSLSIVITMPLYIVSLIYLIKLISTYVSNDDLSARTSLYQNIYQMLFLFSGSLLVFVMIVFSNSTIYHMFNIGDWFYYGKEYFVLIFSLIGISMSISFVYYFKYRKLIKKPIKSLILSSADELISSFSKTFRKSP